MDTSESATTHVPNSDSHSLREIFVLRTQAKAALIRLIQIMETTIFCWKGKWSVRDFSNEAVQYQLHSNANLTAQEAKGWFAFGEVETEIYPYGAPLAQFKRTKKSKAPLKLAQKEAVLRATFEVTHTILSILRNNIKGGAPSEDELEIILAALNLPILAIEYWPNKTIQPRPQRLAGRTSHRSVVTTDLGMRSATEALIEYLKLISKCGPVHALCEQCDALFIPKSDQRFCLKCRKLRQTYKFRKDYLLAKKREYYERDNQTKEVKPNGKKRQRQK